MHKEIAVGLSLFALCISTNVFARDSSRFVCSGFADVKSKDGQTWKSAISIDFFDHRSERRQAARKYTLSSIYQQDLFQGVLYTSDVPYKGKISLQRARKVYFTGEFNLDTQQDGGATMKLDGKLNDDPAESKTMERVTATLPCVDLSQ